MPIAQNDTYSGTAGQPIYAGMFGAPVDPIDPPDPVDPPVEAPPPGSVLTTLTLSNTSATAQAADFVSPMFGLPLVRGHVPAGTFPQFVLEDDTYCPATLWGITSWPDGSMKFCAGMIRVPASVAGSGSLVVEVQNGGTAPPASSRTTAELTPADLKVELTGVTNLSGVWTASLNTAIADATDIVVIGDGAAGKVWRIGGPCKQSGADHGQLHAWHYVAALTNAAGGFLGLRYLGKVGQPWVDVSSPVADRRVASAVLKSGTTTTRSLNGHDATESVGANLGIGHYTSFFTAGVDAKWDYFQSSGTAAADCTVRVVHNKTYFTKSRLVAPFDLALVPNSSATTDYRPYGAGPMQRNMAGTGERDDLGLFPSWAARHLLTQAAVDDRAVRVVGLCSSGWRQLYRRASNGQIIACADPSPSYAGLGAVQPGWRIRPGLYSGGVAPANDSSLWSSEFEGSHRPGVSYYAYLMAGEPQFLDLLVEQASGMMLNTIGGTKVMNTAATLTKSTLTVGNGFGERDVTIGPTTYKGGGLYFIDGLSRVPAWTMRDIGQAGAIYPDTCPWGTETRKYFREVSEACFVAVNAYNATRGQAWRDSGLFSFDGRDAAEAPWCHGFLSYSVAHTSTILGSTAGATLRTHLGRYWSRADELGDIGVSMSYRVPHYDENGVRVEDMEQFAFEVSSTLTFNTSTHRATASGITGSWLPANGDVFVFDSASDPDKPFVEALNYRRLYAVNCTGNTFQLALTPGGAVIPVTSNAAITGFFCRLASFAPHYAAENVSGPAAYVSIIRGAIRMHEACGDTYINSARVNADARLVTSGTSFATTPKNAMSPAYPG